MPGRVQDAEQDTPKKDPQDKLETSEPPDQDKQGESLQPKKRRSEPEERQPLSLLQQQIRMTSGAVPAASSGRSGKVQKEINKSHAASTEAAQLIQLLADSGTMAEVTPGKVQAVLKKIAARLDPDTISACLKEDDGMGVRVVAELRTVKDRLVLVEPLVQSLSAASGEEFHPSFLKGWWEQYVMSFCKSGRRSAGRVGRTGA